MDNCPTRKGTGSLFQDLLSLTIPLKRCTFPNTRVPKNLHTNPVRKLSSKGATCSICTNEVKNLKPFSPEELAIIGENVPSSLLNVNLDFTWICSPCGSILATLSKLRRKIENITICLRTLVGIRLRKQCRSGTDADNHPTQRQPGKKRSRRDPDSSHKEDASQNLEIWDPLGSLKVEDGINIPIIGSVSGPVSPLPDEIDAGDDDDDDGDYVVTIKEDLQSESGEDSGIRVTCRILCRRKGKSSKSTCRMKNSSERQVVEFRYHETRRISCNIFTCASWDGYTLRTFQNT
ncbi:uncharacterized protein LOC110854723 isoform X2 [Folsomia candida]|uniref:uncharacterized protein LOC110854723 isoform X2 n=1 Tax=Folsomia candida TaxID=158441 RepID=UPI001605449D|nr:uncharacterized protein LOC110854723 isoform X2 [Folsomia candida]